MNYVPDLAKLSALHKDYQLKQQQQEELDYQHASIKAEQRILQLEDTCIKSIETHYKMYGKLPATTKTLSGCQTTLGSLSRVQHKRFTKEMKSKYGDKITFYMGVSYSEDVNCVAINREF